MQVGPSSSQIISASGSVPLTAEAEGAGFQPVHRDLLF